MSGSRKMGQLERLVQQQNNAFDRYQETKDKVHLKTVYRCIDKRDKILLSKLRKLKSTE